MLQPPEQFLENQQVKGSYSHPVRKLLLQQTDKYYQTCCFILLKLVAGSLSPVSLERASSEEMPALSNLLERYSYDFSELVGLELGSDGRYSYKHQRVWRTFPERWEVKVRTNNEVALGYNIWVGEQPLKYLILRVGTNDNLYF